VSGPLSVEPIGTTSTTAQVDNVVPPRERRNKTPVYFSGVKNTQNPGVDSREVRKQTRGADERRDPDAGAKTADGFRATIGALRSLDVSEGVSLHTFSLPEDRCVRLLLKNLGKRMPETEIR
jgi:hypothetical protein